MRNIDTLQVQPTIITPLYYRLFNQTLSLNEIKLNYDFSYICLGKNIREIWQYKYISLGQYTYIALGLGFSGDIRSKIP